MTESGVFAITASCHITEPAPKCFSLGLLFRVIPNLFRDLVLRSRRRAEDVLTDIVFSSVLSESFQGRVHDLGRSTEDTS